MHQSAQDGGHSSRQEVRTEQKYVNGKPVYDLYHKRRYEDDRIVHDQKVEKNENDLGTQSLLPGTNPSQSSLTRNSGIRHSHTRDRYRYPSPIGNNHRSTQTYGSGDYSNLHEESESSHTFDREFARMQDNLRRQMRLHGSQQPIHGGSQRSEYSSRVRYVNGKPVYEKKEERRYMDGELVHEDTQEKGPKHFDTEDVVRRYDANGNLITDRSYGGNTHYRLWETKGQSLSPSRRPTYTSGYSSSSQEEEHSGTTYPTHDTPSGSSSTFQSQTYASHPSDRRRTQMPYHPTYNRLSSEQRNTSPYPSNTHSYTIPANQNIRDSNYDHVSSEGARPSYPSRPFHRRPSTPNRDFSRPNHRPVSGEILTYNHDRTHHSFLDSDLTRQHPAYPTDDHNLHVTHVRQSSRTPEDEQPSSQNMQQTAHSTLSWESTRDRNAPLHGNPATFSGTDRQDNYRDYDQLEQVSGANLPHRQPNNGGQHSDSIEEEDESEEDVQQQSDTEDDRYDISPWEESALPPIPPVDNEMVLSGRTPDSTEDEREDDLTSGRSGLDHTRQTSRVWSSNSNEYSRSRGSARDHTSPSNDRQDYLQTLTYEDKARTTSSPRPMPESSRNYQYNETQTSVTSGQHPNPEGLPCTPANGCMVVGAPHTSSRRSETRNVYKYVNGRLIAMTQHERRYENGEMVYDNTTEHGRDEVAHLNLGEYGVGQLDLPQNAIRPGVFSQKHEVRDEKEYIDGQQIYDLHHERHYEDGNLVHNDLIELDEDDLRAGAGLQVTDQRREETIQNHQHTLTGGVGIPFLHQVRYLSYTPAPSSIILRYAAPDSCCWWYCVLFIPITQHFITRIRIPSDPISLSFCV